LENEAADMKRRAEELTKELVDTEETGKQLLKNGDLQSKVTIIPLNKIQTRRIYWTFASQPTLRDERKGGGCFHFTARPSAH